jgi:PRTRC genetic system protein E
MGFFKDLESVLDQGTLHFRMSKKKDVITVMVTPDKPIENLPPLVVNGRAEDLDDMLVIKLQAGHKLTTELKDNLEQIKAAKAVIETKAEKESKEAATKASKTAPKQASGKSGGDKSSNKAVAEKEKPKAPEFNPKLTAQVDIIVDKIKATSDEMMVSFLKKNALRKCEELKIDGYKDIVEQKVAAILNPEGASATEEVKVESASVVQDPEPESDNDIDENDVDQEEEAENETEEEEAFAGADPLDDF